MPDPLTNSFSPQLSATAAAAARAAAQASAAAGTAQGELGYQLTQKTLTQNGAIAFPLMLLEGAAIAEGLTAYAAEDPAWRAAQDAVAAEMAAAVAALDTTAGTNPDMKRAP